MKTTLFKPILLASLMLLSFYAQSSIVRSDVDYQYFRDLAENKGKFAVGASNIDILNKSGESLGVMLPNITMIDFSPILTNGVATLVTHPQYLVSVAHNVGYTTANFGYDTKNPDAHTYDYKLVSRNNYDDDASAKIAETNFYWDYQSPRLSKLVTEVVPATAADIRVVKGATENVLTTNMFFNDSARYTHFIRAGSGVQRIQDADGTRTNVPGGGFLTGGMQMTRHTYNRDALNFIGNPYTTTHGPLVNFAQPGDSGSGLFVWDNQEKKWLFVATLATISDVTNNYIAYRRQFYENLLNRDTAGTIHNTKANSVFTWAPNAEISTISDGTATFNVALFNANLADRWDANPKAQHGKNVFFTGENGTLTLADSINQGAGYLNFNANWTVNSTNNDATWLGAGVIVEQDKTVTWQVKNPQNDRLSKLGTGTLYVNGTGANLGSISVGDGKVILDQQVDNAGNKQAFSELGIVSGRPTVVLNSSDQMNPDNIYFGYRGGRLDVNGNDIVFNHIQSIDDGARIVNHNDAQEATITLAGNRVLPNATEGDLLWGDWGTRNQEKDIYVYNYWGNTYYLARKRTSPSWFPTDGRSNDDWEVLSTNNRQVAIEKALEKRNAKIATQNTARKLDAYNGYLGETDSSLTNGKLNVTYNPTIDGSSLLISGGTNLNGTLTVEKGTLHLSGRPVAYARNRQTNTEIIKDEDWLNRTFTATTFKVSENAKLEVGRNVTEVNGNIEVADNAVAVLGFTQGKSTQCIRSDYTGEVSCEENHRITNAGLASWQKTQVKGDARLTENARLELGSKAEMTGAITAEKSTALLLHEDAVLHLNQDSTTGRVTAAPSSTIHLAEGKNWTTLASSTLGTVNIDNATVKLNDEQASLVSPNTFSASHLKGRGTFHFVVDMVNAVSDVINVTETATGIFNAIITPKGTASSNSPIKLLEASRFDNFQLLLGSAVQSAHYLYNLVKEENAYWLKAVDRRLAFTFDTETLTANSLSADQLSTKGNYLVTINPTGDDPVSTGKTLLIGANNPDQLAGIELELVGADSNNEIQIGPYKYRIAKEADGYYLITDHQQSVLPEEVDDPNYDIVEDEKPVADFNGDTANTTPPATTPPTTTPPTTTPPTTNNPGGNTGTGNSGGQTGGQTGNTGTGNTGTGNTHTTPPETSFTPELQSQVNAVLDTTSTLDNLLRGEHTDNWKVWSRAEHRHSHFDFPTQQAKQQGVLTQVGVEKHLGNRTWVGAVLSQSNNHSEFSKATGQHKLTMLSLYAKKQGENGLFIGGDISGGQSRNRLSLQGERATFQRKILSVGMHLGQEWAWNDIRITPSMGVRYHHLSNADYQLQGKAIHTPHTDVLSYHAGVQVAKTFDLGGWHIKPSLSSSYIHTNQQLTTRVNTTQFNQQLGAHFKHEVGLSVGGKQLSVHMNAGIIRGREIKRQHTAGVKVVYQW